MHKRFLPTAPVFPSFQTNFTATVGAEIKLWCRAKYWDASIIAHGWTKDGIQLKKYETKYYIRFRYLRIRKVEKSDAGKYICWSKQKGGLVQRTFNLIVKGINWYGRVWRLN